MSLRMESEPGESGSSTTLCNDVSSERLSKCTYVDEDNSIILKKYNEQYRQLKKENFDLRLSMYLLEEDLAKYRKIFINQKHENEIIEDLTRQLDENKILLRKAHEAINQKDDDYIRKLHYKEEQLWQYKIESEILKILLSEFRNQDKNKREINSAGLLFNSLDHSISLNSSLSRHVSYLTPRRIRTHEGKYCRTPYASFCNVQRAQQKWEEKSNLRANKGSRQMGSDNQKKLQVLEREISTLQQSMYEKDHIINSLEKNNTELHDKMLKVIDNADILAKELDHVSKFSTDQINLIGELQQKTKSLHVAMEENQKKTDLEKLESDKQFDDLKEQLNIVEDRHCDSYEPVPQSSTEIKPSQVEKESAETSRQKCYEDLKDKIFEVNSLTKKLEKSECISEALAMQIGELKNRVKLQKGNAEKERIRANSIKSEYDGRIVKLEERITSLETRKDRYKQKLHDTDERLNEKITEVMRLQKLNVRAEIQIRELRKQLQNPHYRVVGL
ncbi:putative leucine-rich repeat-containing protein DDB_G0290503 [Aethina tumida]|uniref:putative leucine-rich repeat-containing protein DDB_G0290503 n=1 Tax=Aethina tumida TaxID=116153 RepID=UPI0021473ACE|nr:putative leucine-rich repeat-containing protein DDB_G0290503 [Aethina tumida]